MAKFQGSVRQENVIDFSASISPDSQAATIAFSNLLVSVGGKDSTLVATQAASFTIPTSENATDFHVQMVIRGFAEIQPGTRAILLAHLGDTTALASLPDNDDFEQVLEATFPAGINVQATLFLLAERNAVDENLSVLLTIDALDFGLGEPASGKA